MCSLCGVLRNEHWADEGGGRRSRVLRTTLLERVLGHSGLRLQEWVGQYVVSDAKGRSEVVDDLPGVWVAAERLQGSALDPLDVRLLAALEA